MLTMILGQENDRTLGVLQNLSEGAEEVFVSQEDPTSLAHPLPDGDKLVCALPETALHATKHVGIADALVAQARKPGDLLVWTHSRLIFLRVCRAVAEKTIAFDQVTVLWCGDEPQRFRFNEHGLFAGVDAEHPLPRMFGEDEERAELTAIQQAFGLSINAGKPMKELFRHNMPLSAAPASKPVDP